MSRRTILATATLALTLVGGLAVASPANATAQDNQKLASSPGDVIYQNVWKVKSHGSAYTTYGSWHACVDATKQSKAYTISCTVSTSVSNTLTGSVGVSAGDINASVGFNTSASNSVTGGASFSVPANTSGEGQWRAVYTSYKVLQEQYSCVVGKSNDCTDNQVSETAVASKYKDPTFQFVTN